MTSRLCCVAAVLAALVVAPTGAAARPTPALTCRSGHTAFQQGRTRIFVSRSSRRGHASNRIWYVCSARIRRPHRFLAEAGQSIDKLLRFRAFGERVGFAYLGDDGVEGFWDIGWVDTVTGASRDDNVSTAGGPNAVPFGDIVEVAVGADGAMAFVITPDGAPGTQTQQAICYSANGPHHLGHGRTLTMVPFGDVASRTLALAGGMVSWTTPSGERRSVAVPSP
jgi:hypothetical protein